MGVSGLCVATRRFHSLDFGSLVIVGGGAISQPRSTDREQGIKSRFLTLP